MKMRDLEKLTGVNRETIRVYLREGLLPEPARPKPNVADYDDAHVRGVMAIRKLQLERRLPLAQIRRALEGDTLATPSDAHALTHIDELLATRVGVDNSLVPLATLKARNPQAESDARIFAKRGAITLKRRKGDIMLSRADAQLIGLWGDMRAAGFNEANGFPPDVIDMYVEYANDLARIEVQRFLAILGGSLDREPTAAMAQTAINVMLDFFGLLRQKAVIREFGEQTQAKPARRASRKRAKRP
ncbi:MAG: MerR family transcriptional regulator [Rhizobiales bacterium]|nr:MerR family transcriptional regulator [Hyphomicrobiales bacterium]